MNKLGFYVHVSTIPGLVEAIQAVQPPVLLCHADNRGLLRDMRRGWSPNTFVIGRLFLTPSQQDNILAQPNAEEQGRAFAEQVLRHDFEMARERTSDGRLLLDAWMALNEAVPGPASLKGYQPGIALESLDGYSEMARRADIFDRFQAAFLARLHQEGLEGIAFNFATLNWIEGEHYVRFFPRTLTEARFLGFHEYGWPMMIPGGPQSAVSGCLIYRGVMDVIRKQYGDRHRVVITECGLARAVKMGMPDVGWLFEQDSVSEDQYGESLRWYNQELVRDPYVVGGCLYEVGHAGDWYSFRHLGSDNRGQPIRIIERIARLKDEPLPEPQQPPTEPPKTEEPQPTPPAGRVSAPLIEYVSAQLPTHPQRRYPQRATTDIRRLIIHHTGNPNDVNPDAIARYLVTQRGLPGLSYHFLIRFDGRIQQTQPLTVVSAHTARNNDDSIGVAFAGSFMQGIPTPAQMASGAHLCAYLLDQLGLPVSALVGRRAIEATASPGDQWDQGLRWKEMLLAGVTQRLQEAGASLTATRGVRGLIGAEESATLTPQEEIQELQRLAARLHAEIAELADRLAALTERMP